MTPVTSGAVDTGRRVITHPNAANNIVRFTRDAGRTAAPFADDAARVGTRIGGGSIFGGIFGGVLTGVALDFIFPESTAQPQHDQFYPNGTYIPGQTQPGEVQPFEHLRDLGGQDNLNLGDETVAANDNGNPFATDAPGDLNVPRLPLRAPAQGEEGHDLVTGESESDEQQRRFNEDAQQVSERGVDGNSELSANLTVNRSRLLGTVPTDGTPLTVGRSPDNDIELEQEAHRSSRSHGNFRRDDQGRIIYTDTSTNGSVVQHDNGIRQDLSRGESAQVNPGDTVLFGEPRPESPFARIGENGEILNRPVTPSEIEAVNNDVAQNNRAPHFPWAQSRGPNDAEFDFPWKLHVQADNVDDYVRTHNAISQYLQDNDILYKQPIHTDMLNVGHESQRGKAFTIYPSSEANFRDIATNLDRLIRDNGLSTSGTEIVGDRPLGDTGRLFYRHSGGNNPDQYRANDGNYVPDGFTPADDPFYNFNP